MSPTRAAGMPPIKTVTPPGGRIGPPTCGTTTVTIRQTCMSVTRAPGIPMTHSSLPMSADHDHAARLLEHRVAFALRHHPLDLSLHLALHAYRHSMHRHA